MTLSCSTKPLVSVAIICYNQSSIIAETLSSVIEQTYTNVEIILGDDASDDGTADIAESILQLHERPFTIIRRDQNLGITKNLNDVIARCQGKYIALLGGDDVWFPKKISVSVEQLEANPRASFLCHGSVVVDDNGKEIGTPLVPSASPAFFNTEALLSGMFKFYGSAQVLRNSEDLPAFDVRIKYASDLLHIVDHLEACGPALAIPDLLTRYRKSERGVTIGKRHQIQEDGIQAASLMLLRYPQYSRLILRRMASIFHSNGVASYRDKRYRDALNYFRASFAIKARIKSALRFIAAFSKLRFSHRQ